MTEHITDIWKQTAGGGKKMQHTLQGVLPCSSFLATIIMANHNHMIE